MIFSISVFASEKITQSAVLSGTVSDDNIFTSPTATVEVSTSGSVNEDNVRTKQEADDIKKEKEKTINDINTFLIESYKLKIDRILANLNLSIERVTNNDPVAQAKLLEKIQGDISTKMQAINSRNISGNRKKILSSIFSYIQENLDAKISRLVRQQ